MIGDDMLIMGRYQIANALAINPASMLEIPELKGRHPFTEFCPNRQADYFWGRSEILNVALLQEAINSRINGINRLLRLQENPPIKASGSAGVNQNSLAKLRKPGGWFSDSNPNAKLEELVPQIPETVWAALHEYERMFDEMGGLPPIAKGHGEAGVRSQGHAETLVRMFSPRFKDRALLVERSVEAVGALMLDLGKAHIDKRMFAWVPEKFAGLEGIPNTPLVVPPAPGQIAVPFTFADLDDDMTLTVDAHSSSPAFMQEARALTFDLFKIGAFSVDQVVDRVDIADQEEIRSGIARREAAKAEQIEKLSKEDPQAALRMIQGSKKR
jgi:hypothetical protein